MRLKMCPFCGSPGKMRVADETLRGSRERIYVVACSNKSCGVFKSLIHRTDTNAARDWNHRTPV